MRLFNSVLVAVGVLLISSHAHKCLASDHMNLEEGLPTSLEDAYPTAFRNREFQLSAQYERTDKNKNEYQLEPRLEWGFARNWQGRLAVPVRMGAGHEGSGDIGAEVFYNVNQESLYTPAFAFSAEAIAPSGIGSKGVDSHYRFIMSKTVSRSSYFHQLHANIIYHHNAGADPEDRQDRTAAAGGYSARIDADSLLVIAYFYDQAREKRKDQNLIELGIRRQLTPLTILSCGGAIGVSSDSPDFSISGRHSKIILKIGGVATSLQGRTY